MRGCSGTNSKDYFSSSRTRCWSKASTGSITSGRRRSRTRKRARYGESATAGAFIGRGYGSHGRCDSTGGTTGSNYLRPTCGGGNGGT